MAIYCMQCGKELPDDANFCLKCGKPVKDAVTVTSQAQAAQRWEYCEILCKEAGFLGSKSYFAAQAVSSKGRYEAARSTKKLRTTPVSFTGSSTGYAPDIDSIGSKPLAEAALDEIMSKLSADGWELTGQKGMWWEHKYRRLERG